MQIEGQILEPQGNRIEILFVDQESDQRKHRAEAEGKARGCPDVWRVEQSQPSCLDPCTRGSTFFLMKEA